MIFQKQKKVTSSGARPDDHWMILDQESNAYPTELTWHVLLCLRLFRSLYNHALKSP